jgi:hypothetical protein
MGFDIKYKKEALEIFDSAQGSIFKLHLTKWTSTSRKYVFRYRVDEIFTGKCSALSFNLYLTYLRKEKNYEIIREITPHDNLYLKKGNYILEINAPVKVYVFVNSWIKVVATHSRIYLKFEEGTDIIFGLRSFHKSPIGLINISKSIDDAARAIKLLSSSICIDTCERSYPTLREHPPLLKIEDEFSVSGDIREKKSGVSITIPKKLGYLYVAAPLVYYLLADIEFGSPSLYCDSGFEYRMPLSLSRFEDEVSNVLQRVFFMDCLVRCAGGYVNKVEELKALDGLGLDIKAIFSKRITEQLPIYFNIPREKIERYMPEWHLSYYVKPELPRVEALPFILNRLGMVRIPRCKRISRRELTKASIKDFFRSKSVFQIFDEKNIVKPALKCSQEHIWYAPEIPIGVSKASREAFYNQLKYLDKKEDKIRIALVLNAKKMSKEIEKAANLYSERNDIKMKVKIFNLLSREELASVFEKGFDLVYYVGHCQENGLVCVDGGLKTEELVENNTPLFFLNACNSYNEGVGLLKSGSLGGVVTQWSIMNREAIKMGYCFSRLLENGFPIGKAMELAKKRSLFGKDYLILGLSEYSLVQFRDSFVPIYYTLSKKREKMFLTFHTLYYTIGGFIHPYIEGCDMNYLHFNTPTFEISRNTITKLIEREPYQPVIYGNRLYWMEELADILLK